ncbi:MAG: B12-binding domain-containing radical SAM protein [Proteobacteria bacterium]|nr:B12-binding domain-containing radical SAM protein [Pseudomonadota bacterium]
MSAARRKVVLYNPQAVFFTMPLALLAIGSELDPERYEVVIIDGRLESDVERALAPHLPEAVCLGVTVLTGAPIADALRISQAAKRLRPDLTVVWGGWHPSMFGIECLAEPSVDVTVQGQGEATFAEIVERLSRGESLEGCAGCMVRRPDGSLIKNPPRALLPLESFRVHDYGLIPVERYFDLKGKRQLDYISSQGCNFRCAFCSDPFVYGRKWVGLDPQNVAGALKDLWLRYRFTDVNFQDETFFTKRERVEALAQRMIDEQLPVTWAATMRADQGVRLPPELWQLAKRSGLRRLLVGVESGDDAMLKRIKKDIKIEQVYATAERMRDYGIAGNFPFIVGFPEETDASVRATLECVKRLRAMSPDFETPIFYFKPYPGSAIVLDAVAQGFRLPDSLGEWSRFDFVAGLPGPWVSQAKFQLIERFKFFQELAWRRATAGWDVLQRLARYRCRRDDYRFPIEMRLMNWLQPRERLS